MIIRKAKAADAPSLHELTLGLIEDHDPSFRPAIGSAEVEAAGFGDDPLYEAFVAEAPDGTIAGCVSFFRGYAGWHAKPAGFVHLLFVREDARKAGVARRLMAAVAAVAVERGWVRIDLFAEEGRPSVLFYEAIGMADQRHRHYQISGEAMKALAESLRE